jgi:hypothetical protein
MQQKQSLDMTAEQIADMLYTKYTAGDQNLVGLAQSYVSLTAEADRRWEDANGPYAHPWGEDQFSYTIPQDRADNQLQAIRNTIGARGEWNVGTWGEGAKQFLEKVRSEDAWNDLEFGERTLF